MDDDVSSLNLALPTAGATAPRWVHVMPAGTFKGVTGDQVYHLRNAESVIANSAQGGTLKLPFDENHSTQRATAAGQPSPARGWIINLQNRADGIWAEVDWNPDGQALMTNKSYRNVSPVFGYDADGNVTRLISAALTNNPNLAELTALHSQPSGDIMDRKQIRIALGLAETADDAAVQVALQTAAADRTALATATADVTRLQGELAEVKRTTAPVTDVVALQTRLATIETAGKQTAAEAFVDSAIKAGKPIAAVREQFVAQHVANPALTETMVNGMVSINARAAGGAVASAKTVVAGTAEMTTEDVAVCTKMGLSPEKFIANRNKAAGASEGSAV